MSKTIYQTGKKLSVLESMQLALKLSVYGKSLSSLITKSKYLTGKGDLNMCLEDFTIFSKSKKRLEEC